MFCSWIERWWEVGVVYFMFFWGADFTLKGGDTEGRCSHQGLCDDSDILMSSPQRNLESTVMTL